MADRHPAVIACCAGSDNVALRATFRFGAKIADTSRVVKLTVATPGS